MGHGLKLSKQPRGGNIVDERSVFLRVELDALPNGGDRAFCLSWIGSGDVSSQPCDGTDMSQKSIGATKE